MEMETRANYRLRISVVGKIRRTETMHQVHHGSYKENKVTRRQQVYLDQRGDFRQTTLGKG